MAILFEFAFSGLDTFARALPKMRIWLALMYANDLSPPFESFTTSRAVAFVELRPVLRH
jgi:hypothetical protein